MFIIAGLGNPTKEYEGTRHNAGFAVLDALAEKYNIAVDTKKHRAYIGKGMIAGQKVILAKPQTYMNLSGESIKSLTDYYKVDVESELLIIYDDISLDPFHVPTSILFPSHHAPPISLECVSFPSLYKRIHAQ